VKVPFLDLGAATRELQGELEAAMARVLESGWYLLGAELEAFESAFADFVGAPHCVGVASGLDALTLGLRAAGIAPGDEVLVPAHTYIATWLAVSACGARPVPVDVEDAFGGLATSALEAALSPHTRALLPVHLYGHALDLAPLVDFAAAHDLTLLEDAAQAHGARRGGRPVGSLGGRAAAWSFYPGKNLGALADGGALTTADPELAQRLRLLRNYGSKRKYHHQIKGVNSRLDELQAAVLRVKLGHLEAWNERRRRVAKRYLESLAGLGYGLPTPAPGAEPAWHLFTITSDRRDALRAALEAEGVGALVHYPIPPHLQPAYAELGHQPGDFPVAEKLAKELLSLPIGPQLSDAQQAHVISALRRFAERS